MEQKTSIRRMAWSLFHVHARRAPSCGDVSCCSFTPHVEAAGHGAARPHPWGRRISHMGSRIRTAPARDAPNHPPAPLSGWVRSWPSCPTGASAPPYGAPTTNGRLHWGCHVPHRQEASDELASRRRERGTVSAEPLTPADHGSIKDVSTPSVPHGPVVASPDGYMTHGVFVEGFSVTNRMRLVLLWWISRLPSRVGLMCRTMPA
jgi:hypothetical protein